MLDKAEIERIAEIKRLSVKNAEKDYLLEAVLFILSGEEGKNLVFKGGTALYKLDSLDRFSEDLDFTLCSSKFNAEKEFQKLVRKLNALGINGRVKEATEYGSQKKVKLELKEPLFDGNPNNACIISIDISLKESPLYPAEQRKIFSGYPDIPSFDVFVMPLAEIFAEKIRALLTRDKARDLYDVWFLFNKGVTLSVGDVNKKLKKHNLTFTKSMLSAKIDEKEKSWELDLNGLILSELPNFNAVKQAVLKSVKNALEPK